MTVTHLKYNGTDRETGEKYTTKFCEDVIHPGDLSNHEWSLYKEDINCRLCQILVAGKWGRKRPKYVKDDKAENHGED